ncbi:MAG TPA: AMP nucleosidase [Vitreimonas sp.]|uniref:AMP nucleosidase n=1 Tax=Vitreimonas sp. TaxID=3069702 RepID=UPI002D50A3BA|nr:AMP nucleosidase [Vitreimonas sp.]HYD86596.1 AMP nucleosidase [Vitreimonas sp.]
MEDPKTPAEAVDRLEFLHNRAVTALIESVRRFSEGGAPPSFEERALFRYPELRVTYLPGAPAPRLARAYGQLTWPGEYAVTITQPNFYREYLIEQLTLLVQDYGAELSVRVSESEIPYSYVLDAAGAAAYEKVPAEELARYFPHPRLTQVGDAVVDGLRIDRLDGSRPLALFDALRTDYSLKRIQHYTGAPWADVQPWILFTNYQRYVDEFIRWAAAGVANGPKGWSLSCPGNVHIEAGDKDAEQKALAAPWRKYQMPAYHLTTPERDGVTLVNIGVGPSNAKTITDHLAVLRPHCWLMIGHCGGLRHTQRIGDYVLAHAYLRRDKILDDRVPLEVPIPAIAEVQIALQNAANSVLGGDKEELRRRLRTGTVVSYADRNWELNYNQERQLLSQSRAVAVDMESACVATQGFRLRVPYGVLLCISDKPAHGEIKLPGVADRFYDSAIGAHLRIGLETVALLKQQRDRLHSRKLRAFDEPPFR